MSKKRPSPKSTYRIENWSAYNQALKQRGSLTVWFCEDAIAQWDYTGPRQRGAQYKYSDLAIETALTLRTVYDLALRQTQGFLQSLITLLDLELEAPDYTTLCRRQGSLVVDLPVLASNESVYVVIDSTGLKVYGEGEWKVRQHGYSKRRTWRTLHLGVDEATGDILATTLTTNDVDDASQVAPLLEQIDRPVEKLAADGAYDKKKVYQTASDPPGQSTPIEVTVPPRRDAKIEQHGNSSNPPLPRDETIRAIRRQGRKKWKEGSHYHRRSLDETAMFRYKQIIGPTLKARTFERQQVETKIGCSVLNRMLHLGRPDSYKVECTP